MNPPLPTRLNKLTETKGIDGSPMVFTVVEEKILPAKSNPNKAFALHKFKKADGSEEFRLGYYMIAHKPRMKGKWAWGQFAPMMTKDELLDIVKQMKALKWL